MRRHVLNPILVRFFSKQSQTIYRTAAGRCEGGVSLVLPGLARQVWTELPRVNRCAGPASQRLAATALFAPGG